MDIKCDETRPAETVTHRFQAFTHWEFSKEEGKALPVGIRVTEFDLVTFRDDEGLLRSTRRNELEWGIISLQDASTLATGIFNCLSYLARNPA